jgi:salicylate hydroxylase
VTSPLAIAGGGIAGLTSALCLAKHGIASTVNEQAQTLKEVGAGIQLSPNAMRILIELGLGEALDKVAVRPEVISLHDGRTGARLNSLPLGAYAEGRYGAPYCVIHRADLQAVLAQACKADPQITLKLGTPLKPGETKQPVIAADGVHSIWRTVVREDADKWFTGFVAWRATHEVEPAKTGAVTRVWFGPNAHLVDYPVSAGAQRNLVAIAKVEATPDPADAKAKLIQAFARWDPSIRSRLDALDNWLPWPLNGVDPKGPWVKDKIALIGDAAHATLPFAAQGGGMAIEDAWVLASKLSDEADIPSAFMAYERARKTRATRIWNEAVKNGRIYHLTGPMAFARNMVIKSKAGDELLARYDWLYGWKG